MRSVNGKPVIGITTFTEDRPKKTYTLVSRHYIRSVELAGGLPLMIPLMPDENLADAYLDLIDGLILTGGNEDVCPLRYGENPVKEISWISRERDRFEIRLVRQAFDRKIPVLAICRGMQVMNVAMGGSLYQDIFSQVQGCLGHYPEHQPVDTLFHEVDLKKDSRLAGIFKADTIRVNSFHHQAVKTVADGFRATAVARDNIIEAIEFQGDVPAMGVQWHPEDLTVNYPEFLGLFRFL